MQIEELKVTSIVANTYVGDGQREVSSFEITVNDINLVNDLKAEDFDITNNVSSVPYDVATNALADDYLDDGISLEIKGNTIILNVKAFDYNWTITILILVKILGRLPATNMVC